MQTPVEPDTRQLVRGNNEFAFDLYSKLKDQPGNLFFSPYSISAVLAMVYAGARGRTASEMESVLHFSQGQKVHAEFAKLNSDLAGDLGKGIEMNVANSLWPYRIAILPEYLALVRQYYEGAVTPLDYSKPDEACGWINDWIEDKTNKKIRQLIENVDPLTDLILVNATYFKGRWEIQFDPNEIFDHPFNVARSEFISTPMMFVEDKFAYYRSEDVKILEMPYKGRLFSMVFILPNDVDGLASVEAQLNANTLQSWLELLDEQKVAVMIPKFKMTWGTFNLRDTLIEMGMRAAFDGADFSAMSETPPFISQVLHKAFVEVNEEGTEAAAATAVTDLRGGGPVLPHFVADHPFIFLIRDRSTGSILFMGRMNGPEQGGIGESGSIFDYIYELEHEHDTEGEMQTPLETDTRQLVSGNNEFACDLYSKLKDEPGNLFFSPYSISSALAMVYAGARGRTASEMESVLHFGQGQNVHAQIAQLGARLTQRHELGEFYVGQGVSPSAIGELHIANSLWPRAGAAISPEYLELIKQNYGDAIRPLDFSNESEACAAINNWVAKKTQGKITGLIENVDPMTELVLVGTIYFMGAWEIEFSRRKTTEEPFWVSRNTTVLARMMHEKDAYDYCRVEGVQVLEMNYLANWFSMVFFLPKDVDGLAAVEARMNAGALDSWIKSLRPRKVNVSIPKFKMTWGAFDIKTTLAKMGMESAFDGGDFSGMCSAPLLIGQALHKAFVEVDEGGTVAGAVMECNMVIGEDNTKPIPFIADHPFIFLIRDRSTGNILFMGRMTDPSKTE